MSQCDPLIFLTPKPMPEEPEDISAELNDLVVIYKEKIKQWDEREKHVYTCLIHYLRPLIEAVDKRMEFENKLDKLEAKMKVEEEKPCT